MSDARICHRAMRRGTIGLLWRGPQLEGQVGLRGFLSSQALLG